MTAEITPASERECTNIRALVCCIIFLVVTVISVAYCGIKGAIKNQINVTFFEGLPTLTNTSGIYILIITLAAFIFSYVFLVLFRHCAKQVIWIINIGIVVLVFAIALFFFSVEEIPFSFGFGFVGLVLSIFLCCFSNRIALVAKIFKEASKALMDIPGIMFEPVATFISLMIAYWIFCVFNALVESVGKDDGYFMYAFVFNLVFFIFFTQFIIGCQNFVIAGTISRWYFTHDKTRLRTPIKKSFWHLWKFHLGSICVGAIITTIVKILRMLSMLARLNENESRNRTRAFLNNASNTVCEMIEELMEYLVRNAYIIVAKEGTPFIESGRSAGRLLLTHIKDVIALNHFGDFVLFICRLLIVLIAGCVGYAAMSMQRHRKSDETFERIMIGCIFAFLIAHCFVMVFEMTVDTIFICFCIDCEENDGYTRPYYMSESLQKVMMEMKAQSGGTFNFGPNLYSTTPGMHEESGIPMLPIDQQMQPPQVEHGSQPQEQPMMSYSQEPYSKQPYQPTTYPIHNEKSGMA